jgi:hypothetical protein
MCMQQLHISSCTRQLAGLFQEIYTKHVSGNQTLIIEIINSRHTPCLRHDALPATWNATHTGPNDHKSLPRQGLTMAFSVSYLLLCIHPHRLHIAFSHMIQHEMVVNRFVFHPCLTDWVVQSAICCHTINAKWHRTQIYINLFHDIQENAHLLRCA